ncbi:hypothetical protein [Halorubrum sp. GN11GM_10-3_MGM]|uniref:hypothetical protein n=1 Tax=Halorubrum sp. GN11GM_10-3_MGM TaxID=2518111 RepID=UPI0010F9C409|nr:hypothetical protein [Halorubrum sp. GN11GM_10-3_MGM]TKX70942.1 hypothetical protein EXE40_08580 [Halorubrum sp. GN11GM_10-3_MGM]
MTDDPTSDDADPDESPDDETPDDPDEAPTDGGDEGDERPPIDDDERADVDLAAISEEINEEEGDDDPPEEGSESPDREKDGDTQDEGGDEGGETPDAGPSEGGWGEMYVESLAVLLPEVAAEMRDGDDADAMSSEEVAALASEPPVELDQKFDAVVADMGMEEMSDKQALLVSTAIVCGTVLLKDSDVAGDIVAKASDGVSA